VCAFILVAGPARADVWDTAAESDNTAGTDNELVHGSEQVHDLSAQAGPVADQDWYRVTVPPYSSFEVVVDGTTGDLNVAFDDVKLDLLDGAGAAVLQGHSCIGTACFSKRIGWRNTTAAAVLYMIRVSGAGCTTTCTTSDQYRILARETTVYLARFNNAGTQVTVLLSQNASDAAASASYFYWSTAGALLQTGSLSGHPSKALNVFNTTGFAPLVGVGGSITIAHDAPYGTWNVKSVALEPATGFSFDTPGVIRPY
jgi:hypothetical protein